MEDVIKRIIQIEDKAQNVINSAEQEKIDKKQMLTDKLTALDEKLNKDADRKIRQLRERELSEAKAIALEKRESCVGKIKMIEQNSKDQKEGWVENLFEKVIRGE